MNSNGVVLSGGTGQDTITLSSASLYDNTVIGGGYLNGAVYPNSHTVSATSAVTGAIGATTLPNGGFTTGIGWQNGATSAPWLTQNTAPKINLDGEGADIVVNGWSLIDSIKKIEERLNLLTPNAKLESEWDELRELGDQYRKLEEHIQAKMKTWEVLKKMPPPEIY
jgi:hypothetical protein